MRYSVEYAREHYRDQARLSQWKTLVAALRDVLESKPGGIAKAARVLEAAEKLK